MKRYETPAVREGWAADPGFAARQSPPRRVLVVDDDPQIRALIARFLGRFGYDVAHAENGQEGWRIFRQTPHDLVITDLQMPVMDGAALLARIKTLSRETPVVIITGQGREAMGDLVGREGPPQAVLHKPFTLHTLLKVVAALLPNRAAAAAIINLPQ